MENSAIEWTHHTFNAWVGCTKVSPGCLHCYAETLVQTRFGRAQWGRGQPRALNSDKYWRAPIRWNVRAEKEGVRERVFCASLADVFDKEVDPAWRDRLFDLIVKTPNLDWLLLTKREDHMLSEFNRLGVPKNVWAGVSVENQEAANKRIPYLVDLPCIRFLSMEPLIGPVTILEWLVNRQLDWVIVGGESGPGARPMDRQWVEFQRDSCESAGVPFLFKQWGGVNKKLTGRILDGRTYDAIPSSRSL